MASVIQRNFAAGELSPSLYSRADQIKYQSGLRRCRNFIVRKSGGISNRPGLRFLYEVPDALRLVRFEFSDDQTYVLVFYAGYFRILKAGAWVRLSATPSAWSNATLYTRATSRVTHAGSNWISTQTGTNKEPGVELAYWHELTDDIYEFPTPYDATQTQEFNYQQMGDLIVMVHNGVAPQKLARYAEDNWNIFPFTTGPQVEAPAVVSCTPGAAGSIAYDYTVTSVGVTYEESLASAVPATGTSAEPTPDVPNAVSWTTDPYAIEYNIYKKVNGVYRYLGTAQGNTYSDTGVKPSSIDGPPVEFTMFSTSGDYPAVVAFIQQRLAFASTINEPEKVWLSRIGAFNNFTFSTPLQDDDSISFTLAGRKVSRVRAFIEVGEPIVFTQNGEWLLMGDQNGVLTPTSINAKQMAYNGSSIVDPVVVDNTAIYAQARGSIIRDLRYVAESEGYSGKDLTVYSDHFFRRRVITHISYQQNPYSVVWAVTDDGQLFGLSYLREHEIWGWHAHPTDGEFIDVVSIPEGNDDAVYVLVNRTIEGVERTYVERMEPREEEDLQECFYVDSGLSYDGRNAEPTEYMRIDGGPYTPNTVVPLECYDNLFAAGDVGNAVVLYQYGDDGEVLDSVVLNILEFVDDNNVNCLPNKDVPDWAIGADTADWAWAVDEFAGLGHLEGKSVSILADGTVVSNGVDLPLYVVDNGTVTIPRPATRVHIGLPYESIAESLDIEAFQGESIRSKPKLVTHVSVLVEKANGIRAGVKEDKLREYKIREMEPMGTPTSLKTGHIDVAVPSRWDEETRVIIKQMEPLPVSINAIIPLVAGVGGS